VDLSVVMNSSVAAYIVDKEARFVYHDVSTETSPAKNQISSDRRASSWIELLGWEARSANA
jgi:hypothetical protein